MSKQKSAPGTIATNRKARHQYHIDENFEAGIVLDGWEIKSIRAHKVQIADSHVIIRRGEAWLINAHISPLTSASTHVDPNPTRSRKLLLNRRQINYLQGKVEQKGATIVALSLYFKKALIKVDIALVSGKKLHDKRADLKEKDWQRQQQRIMKKNI